MVRHNFEYPKDATNTVNRYKHQADYSLKTIHSIINSTPILHVSFPPDPTDPFPIILPMIGQMGSFSRPSASIGDTLDCYLHGYVSSRIMNLARSSTSSPATNTSTPSNENEKVAEGEDKGEGKEKGLPINITASRVTGLVLTLTPNSHNYNYVSSTLFGYASLVDSEEEKLFAMELITDSVVSGRWGHSRVPPTRAEMESTAILRVKVERGSAKVREGGPGIDGESRADLKDPATMSRVWTGVLPVYEYIGEPVPGPYNEVKDVPDHVRGYREEFNSERKEYAEGAARKDAPVKKEKEKAGGDGE